MEEYAMILLGIISSSAIVIVYVLLKLRDDVWCLRHEIHLWCKDAHSTERVKNQPEYFRSEQWYWEKLAEIEARLLNVEGGKNDSDGDGKISGPRQ
jgi:hypothetical protein